MSKCEQHDEEDRLGQIEGQIKFACKGYSAF